MKIISVVLVILFGLILAANATPYYTGLVNKDFKRTISLTSQLAKYDYVIKIANEGSETANHYYLSLPETLASKLAYLTVTDEAGKKLSHTILEKKQDIQGDGGEPKESAVMIKVTLPEALKAGSSVTIKAKLVFGHTMEPFPRSISQSERQFVNFVDNHFSYSPYTTTTSTTTVKLASSSVQTSSQLEPTTVKGDTITYGPYENLKPFSHSPMLIHFENNKPFLTISKLNREIEISHWGNIAIEEFHMWKNDGAELKGGFSRYEYQINSAASGHAAIKKVDFVLPKNVVGEPYYRDAIGNISTSHFHGNRLQLIPRFPLFGGWKTKFCVGYDLPAENYLFNSASDSSKFALKIPFGPQLEEDVFIDHQTVKVILPEGATDIKVETPFPVKESRQHHVTYLDLNGRPVVVLEKDNVINAINKQVFTVTYSFNTTKILRGPLLLMAGFFAIFVVIIFASRFNLTILPEDPKAQQENLIKVRGYLKKYKDILLQRSTIHSDLDATVEHHLNTNRVSDINKERHASRTRLEDCAANVSNFFSEIEKFSTDLADKIREIEEQQELKQQAQVEVHKAKLASGKKTGTSGGWALHEKNYHSADEEILRLEKDLIVD